MLCDFSPRVAGGFLGLDGEELTVPGEHAAVRRVSAVILHYSANEYINIK